MNLTLLVLEAFVTFPLLAAHSLLASARLRLAAPRTVPLPVRPAIPERADRLQWN